MRLKFVIGLEKQGVNQEQSVACFLNRKFSKWVLRNRRALNTVDKFSLDLGDPNIFIVENLPPKDHEISFRCRKY